MRRSRRADWLDTRLTVVDNPAGRTPHALNLAIATARHDILVRVDGHGELGPRYIARAVELLAETGAANVGGVMEARGRTPFEQAVAFVYTSRYGLGGAAFHQGDVPAGPADTVFLGVFDKAELKAVPDVEDGIAVGGGLEATAARRAWPCRRSGTPPSTSVQRWPATSRCPAAAGRW